MIGAEDWPRRAKMLMDKVGVEPSLTRETHSTHVYRREATVPAAVRAGDVDRESVIRLEERWREPMEAVGIRSKTKSTAAHAGEAETDFEYFALSAGAVVWPPYEGPGGLGKVLGILRSEELKQILVEGSIRTEANLLREGFLLVAYASEGKKLEFSYATDAGYVFGERFELAGSRCRRGERASYWPKTLASR